jgi:cobalt/nickel transport system permease protein
LHIPEGYLSPQTYGAAYLAMLPIWALAGRRARRALSDRRAPLIAICAAFSFVVMMFNIPIPGGSTGHATGGALIAIVLGPWAAVLVLSAVLAVQALLFQDGGITALGANCFSMAFVMPFVSYAVYRLLAIGAPTRSTRRVIAAGAAGYVGLNAAALITAIMFGIQPLIAHAPDGRPLYCPYGLGIAVPVMAGEHLLLFGFVEAGITALAVAHLSAAEPELFSGAAARGRGLRRLVWVVGALALLTPLGLWLPAKLGATGAWGEWGPQEIGRRIGFVPQQLGRLADLWKAPLPDYAPQSWAGKPLTYQGLAYLLSALLGAGACGGVFWLAGGWLAKRRRGETARPAVSPEPERPDRQDGTTRLPVWLSQPVQVRSTVGRRRVDFIDRALRGSARFVSDTVLTERVARRPGFLQSLDARTKLLTFLGLLVAASFLRHLPSLWLLGAIVAATAALSKIGTRVLFHRVWWLLPATFMIVALPAALNLVTPGDPLVVLYRSHRGPLSELSITRQGLAVAALVVTRISVGVLLAVTLALTTRWQELLRAAHTPVTAPFVFILSMSYRYLFVLLRSFEDMHLALRARTISPRAVSEQRRWVGSRIGALFLESRRLSEQIYEAMRARGHRGEPKALIGARFRVGEAAWVAGTLAVTGFSFLVDRVWAAHLPW